MSNPTPGPWRVGEDSEGARINSSVRGPEGQMVATAHGFLSVDWEANARLIAAAPDMLEALQELEEFLDNQADVDDGIPNDAMRHLVEVRAAIAKATQS